MKRAEHLIYVSLKYTRTVDVFRSIIERLISAFDVVIEALLKKAEEDNRIFEVPVAPRKKVEELIKLHQDKPELHEYLNFYLFLRQLMRANYTRSNEYRRHVTMTATLDNSDVVEVTMETIEDYYKKAKEFVDYTRKTFEGSES